METNSRKINVEISGVPMESNENCGKIIQKLAALMKVENFDKNSIRGSRGLRKPQIYNTYYKPQYNIQVNIYLMCWGNFTVI